MSTVKSFRQFLEATARQVVITFGRFNPPTTGHEKLLNAVAAEAGAGPYRVYASQSVDPEKNPLNYAEKVKLMREMFPKHARSIMADKSVRTVLDAASKAYDDGFTRLVLVVGQDRVPEFSKLLNKYEGTKLNSGGFFEFPNGIEVVSAGDRDPDSDDVEGMSASKMRQAAREGNLKSFAMGLPHGYEDAISLFNLLRKRMGLKETTNFREHVQLSPLSAIREAYVRGEVFRVGEQARLLKGGEVVTIVERGPNFLVTNDRRKHWLQDVEPIREGWAHDEHRRLKGKNVLYIDDHDHQDELTKRNHIQSGLDAISKQPQDAFKVFRNMNGDTAFKQIKWLPNFYLV